MHGTQVECFISPKLVFGLSFGIIGTILRLRLFLFKLCHNVIDRQSVYTCLAFASAKFMLRLAKFGELAKYTIL